MISFRVQKLRAHKDDQVDSQLTQINKNWLGPCPWCYPNDPCEWCREWSVTDHSRRDERLQVLQQHFTRRDLEFVRGKIVLPLVGAPWLRPFGGCQQTKRVTVGDIIIRIRAVKKFHNQFYFSAEFAPIDGTRRFCEYVYAFDEHFQAI